MSAIHQIVCDVPRFRSVARLAALQRAGYEAFIADWEGKALDKKASSARTRSAPGWPGEADSSRTWRAALRLDPRQAIQENTIRCLICGRTFRQLTNTHFGTHGIGSAEYKRRFGYNRGRSLMCHALSRLYAERAVRTRLAARIRSRPILLNPELRRRGGARRIALEESLTRREARLPP